MAKKLTQPADLNHLRKLVSSLVFGESGPLEIRKLLRKEIVRAKRALNIDREARLRLMMGTVEHFGHEGMRAERQYRAVLDKRPDCAEAMKGMASLLPRARAVEWLERAAEACERRGDYAEQLDAFDRMLWGAPGKDAAATVYARMCAVLDRWPDAEAYSTIGSDSLLMHRRGPETVDYLEHLLRHMIKRSATCGWQSMAMRPLVAAYSQCGLTADEARPRLLQFGELCPDDDTRCFFDAAIEWSFQPEKYYSLEAYGMELEWFPIPQKNPERSER